MSTKRNLTQAQTVKRDEFYTQLSDIENELKHYKSHFKDKVVFCNCDDPEESNFWKYFSLNFERLGLKKLVSTHFKDDEKTYKLEISKDINGDGKVDWKDVEKTVLKGNGDFRSPESIEILKDCDIVVTNPPFSLMRDYVKQLMEFKKDFIIIGPANAATYKEINPLIVNNKMWAGNTSVKKFRIPKEYHDQHITKNSIEENGEFYAKFGNICWFTNVDHNKRHDDLVLYRKYDKEMHIKYDNSDAININTLKDIPIDYNDKMGVPMSFLNYHNPEQFEIIGFRKGDDNKDLAVNGKSVFARLIVKKVIK